MYAPPHFSTHKHCSLVYQRREVSDNVNPGASDDSCPGFAAARTLNDARGGESSRLLAFAFDDVVISAAGRGDWVDALLPKDIIRGCVSTVALGLALPTRLDMVRPPPTCRKVYGLAVAAA